MVLASTGPWDVIGLIVTTVGGIVLAVIGLQAKSAGKDAKTAAAAVAADVSNVREAVGTPNGHGSAIEAIGAVHDRIAAIATAMTEHTTQDAEQFTQIRRAFDKQTALNSDQATINTRVLTRLDQLEVGLAALIRSEGDGR